MFSPPPCGETPVTVHLMTSLDRHTIHTLLGDLRVQGIAGAAIVLSVPVGVLRERGGASRGPAYCPAPSSRLRYTLAEVSRGLEELAAEAVVAVVAGRFASVGVHVLLQLALVTFWTDVILLNDSLVRTKRFKSLLGNLSFNFAIMLFPIFIHHSSL